MPTQTQRTITVLVLLCSFITVFRLLRQNTLGLQAKSVHSDLSNPYLRHPALIEMKEKHKTTDQYVVDVDQARKRSMIQSLIVESHVQDKALQDRPIALRSKTDDRQPGHIGSQASISKQRTRVKKARLLTDKEATMQAGFSAFLNNEVVNMLKAHQDYHYIRKAFDKYASAFQEADRQQQTRQFGSRFYYKMDYPLTLYAKDIHARGGAWKQAWKAYNYAYEVTAVRMQDLAARMKGAYRNLV